MTQSKWKPLARLRNSFRDRMRNQELSQAPRETPHLVIAPEETEIVEEEAKEALNPEFLFEQFPFPSHLSLRPLIKKWQSLEHTEQRHLQKLAHEIQELLEKSPRLKTQMIQMDQLTEQPFFIELLTSLQVSYTQWQKKAQGAMKPFVLEVLYANQNLSQILFKGGTPCYTPMGGEGRWLRELIIRAYQKIGHDLFQLDFDLEPLPLILKVPLEEGLERYLEVVLDDSLVEVTMASGRKELSLKDKEALSAKPLSLSTLLDLLPPEDFHFSGLMLFEAIDLTQEMTLKELRKCLRADHSFTSLDGFQQITSLIRNYFQISGIDLELILTQGDRVVSFQTNETGDYRPVMLEKKLFNQSLMGKSLKEDHCEAISDLENLADPLMDSELKEQFSEVYLIPLKFLEREVGVLEVRSKVSELLKKTSLQKVHRLKNLLSEELDRKNQTFRLSIQAVILEKYTAIHPSVEWAFRDAALDYVNQKLENEMPELRPIVFRDVFPLYGASDIRGSSSLRNKAIQQDLRDQVYAAKEVIDEAIRHNPMPKFQEIRYRLQSHIDHLTEGLMAGDEINVLEFLNGEVETVFEAITESIPEVEPKIEGYRSQINTTHGVFYQARKDFDHSVTLLNEAIASYYDEEQIKFQTFFPHYFEKQSTDGVDHTIYIGAPLVKDKSYHPIYLENIRIWQIMVICGAAYVADNLSASLPVPLELTHLVVVQDAPLSIRFSQDEKQFEVDGAYNIRYEIMKKRIDKAKIKDTDERLTQPGKLAIVYTSKKEKSDYEKYLRYLASEKYLLDDIEDLVLEDLQGISGLRALRVGINIKGLPRQKEDKAHTNLSHVVNTSRRWLIKKRREMEETAQQVSLSVKRASEKRKKEGISTE